MAKTTAIYCVKCSQPVHRAVPGVGGVMVHTGHEDPQLDRTCGQWGYRPERPSDRDEG